MAEIDCFLKTGLAMIFPQCDGSVEYIGSRRSMDMCHDSRCSMEGGKDVRVWNSIRVISALIFINSNIPCPWSTAA